MTIYQLFIALGLGAATARWLVDGPDLKFAAAVVACGLFVFAAIMALVVMLA